MIFLPVETGASQAPYVKAAQVRLFSENGFGAHLTYHTPPVPLHAISFFGF